MKIKRRIEITTETEEVLVVRGRPTINPRCDVCGGQAELVPAEHAEEYLEHNLARPCRRAEYGKLHWKETKVLLICLSSLADDEIVTEGQKKNDSIELAESTARNKS